MLQSNCRISAQIEHILCGRALSEIPASLVPLCLQKRIAHFTVATAQVVLCLERFECLEYEGAREGVGVPLESLKIADCGLLTGTTISFPRSITIAAVEV